VYIKNSSIEGEACTAVESARVGESQGELFTKNSPACTMRSEFKSDSRYGVYITQQPGVLVDEVDVHELAMQFLHDDLGVLHQTDPNGHIAHERTDAAFFQP
jgi:hypothetical protein